LLLAIRRQVDTSVKHVHTEHGTELNERRTKERKLCLFTGKKKNVESFVLNWVSFLLMFLFFLAKEPKTLALRGFNPGLKQEPFYQLLTDVSVLFKKRTKNISSARLQFWVKTRTVLPIAN
jgi:hypothetical protein